MARHTQQEIAEAVGVTAMTVNRYTEEINNFRCVGKCEKASALYQEAAR